MIWNKTYRGFWVVIFRPMRSRQLCKLDFKFCNFSYFWSWYCMIAGFCGERERIFYTNKQHIWVMNFIFTEMNFRCSTCHICAPDAILLLFVTMGHEKRHAVDWVILIWSSFLTYRRYKKCSMSYVLSTVNEYKFNLSFNFLLFWKVGCWQLHFRHFECWMYLGTKKVFF